MPQEPYVYKAWPAWRYGPKDQCAIFEREEDVPDGWADHPKKVVEEAQPPSDPPVVPVIEAPVRGRPRKAQPILGSAMVGRATREEALVFLRGRGVLIADDASDDEIVAAMERAP